LLNFTVHEAPSEPEKEEIRKQERSLVYVALTRARKSAVISWHGKKSLIF